jgi:hypothetical protein
MGGGSIAVHGDRESPSGMSNTRALQVDSQHIWRETAWNFTSAQNNF